MGTVRAPCCLQLQQLHAGNKVVTSFAVGEMSVVPTGSRGGSGEGDADASQLSRTHEARKSG